MKPSPIELERLVRSIILPFHEVERNMPLPISQRRKENDAEHSWSLALLACALAPQVDQSLDVGKIAQYAIVHDVVEIYAGDTSAFASDQHQAQKVRKETQALSDIEHICKDFPWIAATIRAYEAQEDDESAFVHSLDKYIAVAYVYIDQGRRFRERGITQAQYIAKMRRHQKKAQSHPAAAYYYNEIRRSLEAHPEYFASEE